MDRHLVLLRHGQSAMNAEYEAGGKKFCGQFDTPLTEHGRRQATEAGIRLGQRADLQITHAVSSVLPRARDTLELVLPHLPATVVRLDPTPQLNERSLGEFEGLVEQDVFQRWPHYASDEQLKNFRADWVQKAPGGENLAEVVERAWDYLERLRPACAGDLLVVSHSMTIRCIVGRALGLNVANWVDTSVKHARPLVLRGDASEPIWAGRMERLE